MENLTDREREVWKLWRRDGLSIRSIADKTGVSKSTVDRLKKKISRKEHEYGIERAMSEVFIERLEKNFIVDEAVRGTHYMGDRLRLDAVLTAKPGGDWGLEENAMGVVFRRKEAGVLPEHVALPSTHYAATNWDGYGYMYVFPFLLPPPAWSVECNDYVTSMMMFCGVGAVYENDYKGLEFCLGGGGIWSEEAGWDNSVCKEVDPITNLARDANLPV